MKKGKFSLYERGGDRYLTLRDGQNKIKKGRIGPHKSLSVLYPIAQV